MKEKGNNYIAPVWFFITQSVVTVVALLMLLKEGKWWKKVMMKFLKSDVVKNFYQIDFEDME